MGLLSGACAPAAAARRFNARQMPVSEDAVQQPLGQLTENMGRKYRGLDSHVQLNPQVEQLLSVCAVFRDVVNDSSAMEARKSETSLQQEPRYVFPSVWLAQEICRQQQHVRPEGQPKQSADDKVHNSAEDQISGEEQIRHRLEELTRHNRKECKPCIFWYNNCCKQAQQGGTCSYCHLDHRASDYKQLRLSRLSRNRLRAGRKATAQAQRQPSDSVTCG